MQTIQRQVGLTTIYALSPTPIFLGGSGYSGGDIFPGVVRGSSLMGAIECGIVRVRVDAAPQHRGRGG